MLTPEQTVTVAKRLLAGVSQSVLARQYGVSRQRMEQIKRRAQLYIEKQGNLKTGARHAKVSAADRLEIREKLSAGARVRDLAGEYKVTHPVISMIRKRAGLQPRPRTLSERRQDMNDTVSRKANELCAEVRDEIIVRELLAGTMTRHQISLVAHCSVPYIAKVAERIRPQIVEKEQREFAQREEERRLEAQQAVAKKVTILREAQPDGTKCVVKACPFPAMIDGRCRQHWQDTQAEMSLIPSTIPLGYDWGYGRVYTSAPQPAAGRG